MFVFYTQTSGCKRSVVLYYRKYEKRFSVIEYYSCDVSYHSCNDLPSCENHSKASFAFWYSMFYFINVSKEWNFVVIICCCSVDMTDIGTKSVRYISVLAKNIPV